MAGSDDILDLTGANGAADDWSPESVPLEGAPELGELDASALGELTDFDALLVEKPAPAASAERPAPPGETPAAGTPGASGDAAAAPDADSEEPGGRQGGGRRRRDPFAGVQFSSSQAAMQARGLTTLSDIKRIKRARVKHEGQRVVTDDVKKLKSLSIEPRLTAGEYINYYVEPVRIEYYIPRESRFAVETRYLYIPLIDPTPREHEAILKEHIAKNRFVDLIEIMNEHPMHITDILESYNGTMHIYESLSRAILEADQGSDEAYRTAFYLVEVLMEYEPTYAALEFLGDFLSWNLNWLIRAMNALVVEFAASDKTISYLIKKRNIYWEQYNLDYDERFEILAALFFEQAFPNRGLEIQEEDYFYDIFDKKFKM